MADQTNPHLDEYDLFDIDAGRYLCEARPLAEVASTWSALDDHRDLIILHSHLECFGESETGNITAFEDTRSPLDLYPGEVLVCGSKVRST